ncbi:MAG: TMEM165/GDT1 family protein [Pseudonocardiaceae bacterium]
MQLSPIVLATTFALVLPAELPDKTMFTTLLLATRYRPLPVLLGVASAFAVQCVVAVAFGSVLTLLPGRIVALVTALLFTIGAVLLLRQGFGAGHEQTPNVGDGNGAAPWRRAAAVSFGMLFAAEWGDASQLATAALTARYDDPVSVGLGSWLALVVVGTLAVLVGKGFADRFPTTWLQRIAGAIFAVFAVLAGAAALFG